MNENGMIEDIIKLLKKNGWKEQTCGMTFFSGSTGTNLYKSGKVLSVSILEEGHMAYPDPDELEDMFGELEKNGQIKKNTI